MFIRWIPLAAFASTTALAAPSTNPEFLHQAPMGAFELTPEIDYAQVQVKSKSNSTLTAKGLREGVRFEAGINEMISAGAVLGFHNIKSESSASGSKSTTESGLEDFVVFMRGRTDMPTGSFRYGVDVNFALEKEKIKDNGDSNAGTGGIGLAPFVGFETAAGNGTVGARLSYEFLVADRKGSVDNSGQTTDITTTGGNSLKPAVFYEMPMETATLGLSYEMTFMDRTYVKATADKVQRTAPYTSWELAAYVPVDVTPTVRILPRLKYGQYSAFDTTGIDSAQSFGVEVGARFVF